MTDDHGSCCTPGRMEPGDLAAPAPRSSATGGAHLIEQIAIPAGRFAMGDSSGHGNLSDGELPVHEVELSAFSIDATSVTNDAFAAFVDATGYTTEAESFGYSAVFHLAVQAPRTTFSASPRARPGGAASAEPTGGTRAVATRTSMASATTPSLT
jgi:sulfatase modifying factor 1